jgi:hypothetical protein
MQTPRLCQDSVLAEWKMNLNTKSGSRRKELKVALQLNADPTHSQHSQSLSEPSSLRLVRTQRRRQKKELKQKKENITKIKNMFSLEIELIAQPQARICIGDERGIKHSGIKTARNCRGTEKQLRKKTEKN